MNIALASDSREQKPAPDDAFGQSAYLDTPQISSIDVLEAFCQDNQHRAHAVEYLLRAGRKTSDPTADLRKAIWWIEREIAQQGKKS